MKQRGSIYRKPGTDCWTIQYYVKGKVIKEATHTRNRNKAMGLLNQRLADLVYGKPVFSDIDKTMLDELLAMVSADYQANSRRSLGRVTQAAAHLRRHFGANRKARDIGSDSITDYAARRRAEGASPATVNYELAILRRAFRLGVRAGKVGVRPEIQMLHVENARKGFFEVEQYRALLRHLPDYLKPVCIVAYITGWRVNSELLTRQWRHVDFSNGWLRLEPGESKNGEGREFPFTPELRAALEEQRERVRELERATGQIIPWVFVHFQSREGRAAAGSPIREFRTAWKKSCREAGVPGRLVHDFRRTAVRNLERAGVPRSAAMKMTGHKTEAVYRRYAITDAAMLQESGVKLSALHQADFEKACGNDPKTTPIGAIAIVK